MLGTNMTDMINSRELMKLTGISRATLYNYISMGLLPRPIVEKPYLNDSSARRIGYFPANSVKKINKIVKLKKSGRRMPEIINHFVNRIPLTGKSHLVTPVPMSDKIAKNAQLSGKLRPYKSPIKVRRAKFDTLFKRDNRLVYEALSVLMIELDPKFFIKSILPPDKYFPLLQEALNYFVPKLGNDAIIQITNSGTGMICYYTSKLCDHPAYIALQTAIKLQKGICDLSTCKQFTKYWEKGLKINIGLDYGHEWIYFLEHDGIPTLSTEGDTTAVARLLSRISPEGSTWISKRMLSSLSISDRNEFIFGVPNAVGGHSYGNYSTIEKLNDNEAQYHAGVKECLTLPVTQIIGTSHKTV